jgi:hypothetical protein
MLLASAACDNEPDNTNSAVVTPLRDVTVRGHFTEPDLVEASGLVASSREPNVFWAQNDSGNDERVFAFDSTGRAVGAVRIAGATNKDWETIAIGPCDAGSCLYVGDVGDNGARREAVFIYRVSEPASRDTVTANAQRLTVQYVDGPHDVEALWVAPDTSVYLVTKRPERRGDGKWRMSRIYRVAPDAWHRDATAIAQLVDSVPVTPKPKNSRGWITDASVSPADSSGARRLALRTYEDVYIFALDSTAGHPGALIARCGLSTLRNATGEGVTWLGDGRLLFDAEGAQATLHAGRCP